MGPPLVSDVGGGSRPVIDSTSTSPVLRNSWEVLESRVSDIRRIRSTTRPRRVDESYTQYGVQDYRGEYFYA